MGARGSRDAAKIGNQVTGTKIQSDRSSPSEPDSGVTGVRNVVFCILERAKGGFWRCLLHEQMTND